MKDSIKALAAQHQRVQAKRSTLYKKAHDLEVALTEAFTGSGIYAIGAYATLEETGPAESTNSYTRRAPFNRRARQ